MASEFRYRNPIITPTTLVVAVSQSGGDGRHFGGYSRRACEGRARVRHHERGGWKPRRARERRVIYTKANKEIAVASTKSFLGQVVSLTLLALLLAQVKGKLKTQQVKLLFSELAGHRRASRAHLG